MTVVTAHQPNFLPGMSVVTKILASDFVIWLDGVQYTKGGWTNRNRLPDGEWLTAPVEKHCAFKPINRVRLSGRPWQPLVADRVRQAWGDGPEIQAVCRELTRPYGLLIGLNAGLLELCLPARETGCRWAWQSQLDSGHAVVAVSEDREELLPISDRLAMMVAELNGDTYLSGPSGRNYLNEEPFHELGIRVEYWEHEGPNPCLLDWVSSRAAA